MHLRSLLALGSVVAATRPTLGSRAQGARVEYGCRGLGRSTCRKAQKHAQIVDHRLEDLRRQPPPRLLVDGFPWWQVVGHVAPWRAGFHDPPESIEDLAQIVGT